MYWKVKKCLTLENLKEGDKASIIDHKIMILKKIVVDVFDFQPF